MNASIDDRLRTAGLPQLPRTIWLEIDEAALASNLHMVGEMAGPGVEINAVVKADAYGHGLLPVARVFERAGADRLCVASFDEALALRDAGIRLPILVLFPTPLREIADEAAERRIELTLSDRTSAGELAGWWARQTDERLPQLGVHIEVETGLTRGGFDPADVGELVATIGQASRVRMGGLWTHMATSEDAEYTARQVAAFDSAVDTIRRAGLPVPARHIAATGALLTGRVPAYEGVRIGMGLYGLLPEGVPVAAELRPLATKLRPALALKCRALRIERFPPGTRVSYGGRWTSQRESLIATLPVGYADAIPRPSGWPDVLAHGRRVPLVGTVAMDAVMVDVTDIGDGIEPDDEFVLLGNQAGETITAHDVARVGNTIAWEVLTSMEYRVPRVYHAGSVLLGLRTLTGEVRTAEAVG